MSQEQRGDKKHEAVRLLKGLIELRHDDGYLVSELLAAIKCLSTPSHVAPIPMVLYCPLCGVQHIDKPQPEKGWTNPPHRSHECQACGNIWRPADVHTVGVETITTKGKADTWTGKIDITARSTTACKPRCSYVPLTEHEIDLIQACLDDGTYTQQEQKDIGLLCSMATNCLLYAQEIDRLRGELALTTGTLESRERNIEALSRELAQARAEVASLLTTPGFVLDDTTAGPVHTALSAIEHIKPSDRLREALHGMGTHSTVVEILGDHLSTAQAEDVLFEQDALTSSRRRDADVSDVTPGNQQFPIPAACPRCQQDMIWPGRIRQLMKGYWCVECPCGWSGPTTNNEVSAAIRWNAASAEKWLEFEAMRREDAAEVNNRVGGGVKS